MRSDLRKTELNYRRGWNSYTDTPEPPLIPDSQAPTIDQGTSATSPDADADAVKRLNEQELKGLRRP
jgi:hypothetical protein